MGGTWPLQSSPLERGFLFPVAGLAGVTAMLVNVLFHACHLPSSFLESRDEEVALLRDVDQRDFGALFTEMWHNSFLQREDFVFLLLSAGIAVSSEEASSRPWLRATFSCLMSVAPVSRIRFTIVDGGQRHVPRVFPTSSGTVSGSGGLSGHLFPCAAPVSAAV